MNAEARREKLNELRKSDSNVAMTGVRLQYKGQVCEERVFRIPLDYLVYNKYNGRIGSEVLSYEKQNGELNAEDERDRELIEKFLFESKRERNETTMKNLMDFGQQRYGIVTADGIIVDGNRRAMLLNRLYHKRADYGYTAQDVEKCRYFLAVILPDNAEERDIQQLETIYQMGEDDKLDYNPIEKYIKCKKLKELGFSEEDIAGFMSEKAGKIKEWLRILSLMEEYLMTYDYEGIYTRLEKTEGQFVDLAGYLESYKKKGANVRNVDWEYDDTDLSDLKQVCFDYIRARYEGKEFRDIAKTGKEGSLFFFGDLWRDFFQKHQESIQTMEEVSVEELRKNNPSEDLSKLLRSRDNDWKGKAENKLKWNLKRYARKLEDKQAANKPADLLERALSALKAIDTDQQSFLEDSHIVEMVKEINRLSWDMKKILDRS